MPGTDPNDETHDEDATSLTKRPVNRRQFLKLAGIVGISAAAAGGLGGLLSACGDDEETPVTTAGSVTTAGVEMGREIKIGFVTPITGGIAAMGQADQFCVDEWVKAIGDGLVCGDGKKHPVKFEVLDSQSDSMRASQVAGDLIQNVNVDIIMAAATPDTVNPVADTAESMGKPCLTCDTPTESYYFGRGATPEKPFKWTYHAFWGMQQIQNVSLSLWDQIATNKVVGALWPNNVDGNAYRDSYPPFMDKNGYTLVDGGMYQEPNEDWTAMISEFKKAGAEIFTGVMIPPDFANFWKQANQQGWKPKVFDMAKAILFPAAMQAVGEIGYNLSGPMYWHATFPFTSPLSGMTCQQIADEWERQKNDMWQQPLLHYLLGDWVTDVLKRTKNVDDKEDIMATIASTNLKETIGGPLDFTAPIEWTSLHPVQNVCVTPLYGGQWVKGAGKYMFDIKIVSNPNNDPVTIQQELIPLN